MQSTRRIFWTLLGTHAAVFVPLVIGGLLLGLLFSPPDTGIPGTLLGLVLLSAAAASITAASLSANQVARSLTAVQNSLNRITAGEYNAQMDHLHDGFVDPLAEVVERTRDHLKQRFSELQTNRDLQQAVLDSMLEGVVTVDQSQRIVLLNQSACQQLRLEPLMSIGRPLWEVIRNPNIQDWTTAALRSFEPVGGEVQLPSPVNRVLTVRAVGLPKPADSASDRPPGAIVVLSDISELRRLEGVRKEFVSNASHELKTPLASIKACVETLLDGAWDDAVHRERFLNTIDEQAERLDKLVRDMLALTRVESAEMRPDLTTIDLREMIETSRRRHLHNAQRKQMLIEAFPPVNDVQVLADEEAVLQILDNLLDNAIKYTNPGGKVQVRWRAEGDDGILEVEDNGIGIAQNQLSRIFERFYRVDKARSREVGGTGLGLSIVKHMAQAVGGNVAVTSRLGSGTQFTVRFRLANSAGPAHSSLPESA